MNDIYRKWFASTVRSSLLVVSGVTVAAPALVVPPWLASQLTAQELAYVTALVTSSWGLFQKYAEEKRSIARQELGPTASQTQIVERVAQLSWRDVLRLAKDLPLTKRVDDLESRLQLLERRVTRLDDPTGA